MTAGYRIAEAEPEHLAGLRAVELAAASLLVPHASTSVVEETTPDEVFREAQRERRLWVALVRGAPIGFALVEMLGEGRSHLQEIDVAPRHGRQGVGTALVATVLQWARKVRTRPDYAHNLPRAALEHAVLSKVRVRGDLRGRVVSRAATHCRRRERQRPAAGTQMRHEVQTLILDPSGPDFDRRCR